MPRGTAAQMGRTRTPPMATIRIQMVPGPWVAETRRKKRPRWIRRETRNGPWWSRWPASDGGRPGARRPSSCWPWSDLRSIWATFGAFRTFATKTAAGRSWFRTASCCCLVDCPCFIWNLPWGSFTGAGVSLSGNGFVRRSKVGFSFDFMIFLLSWDTRRGKAWVLIIYPQRWIVCGSYIPGGKLGRFSLTLWVGKFIPCVSGFSSFFPISLYYLLWTRTASMRKQSMIFFQ